MTVELKNESTGVKHFLEAINELSNIDNSLNEEVDNFAKSIRDRYLSNNKLEKERILNGIEEAVQEIKDIESGKIKENELETIDNFLAKYKW